LGKSRQRILLFHAIVYGISSTFFRGGRAVNLFCRAFREENRGAPRAYGAFG
jgi:hypothetical protein